MVKIHLCQYYQLIGFCYLVNIFRLIISYLCLIQHLIGDCFMKFNFRSFAFIVSFFTSFIISQPTFTEHAISTSANGARSVYAADVDGDGDMDVLSASGNDDKIAW